MQRPLSDLSAPRMLNGLVGSRFRHVEVHASIDSTQSMLVREGGRDGRVVVADHQTAGRGRSGRSWLDVPGAMLMFSALLRDVVPSHASSIALMAGVAVASAIGERARLKWPNDVRIGGRKVCGMIGELAPSGEFVVIGIGVNVGHQAGELPEDLGATSLNIEGIDTRRDDLCVNILKELEVILTTDRWLDRYRGLCETVGRRVRVEMADRTFEGMATEVRDDGALIVDERAVVAGDVVHVR